MHFYSMKVSGDKNIRQVSWFRGQGAIHETLVAPAQSIAERLLDFPRLISDL